VALNIESLIRADERVERVDWLVGGSIPSVYYNLVMTTDNRPNYAQAVVTTRQPQDTLGMISTLQSKVDQQFPESQVVMRQLAQGPPVIAPIEIRVYGPSVKKLRELGHEIQLLLSQTPGVIHTRTTFDASRSKIKLLSNEAEAQLAGLSFSQIAAQLQTNLEGATGGVLLESTEQLPVRVRLGNQIREELNEIASNRLQTGATSDGSTKWMPLESVADIEIVPEESSIPRRNGQRCNTIQAFVVAGALPPEITDLFLAKLDESDFQTPTGYRLQVGGDSEELANSMSSLFAYAPVLGVMILATLILSFRSFVLAGIIGTVAGLSAGIAFFSIWVSGYALGFNPLIGMAGLIGLAINDSIVVLTQIRSNPQARSGNVGAIVNEVMKTGRHVISTTLTTIGGFLPLLLGGGTFWPPLAVVIAGGVGGATILATVFVPAAYVLVAPLVDKITPAHARQQYSTEQAVALEVT
jgi:multidrug efflux pump subunit AcrB